MARLYAAAIVAALLVYVVAVSVLIRFLDVGDAASAALLLLASAIGAGGGVLVCDRVCDRVRRLLRETPHGG